MISIDAMLHIIEDRYVRILKPYNILNKVNSDAILIMFTAYKTVKYSDITYMIEYITD